ncbi:hypothetical protein GLYMA_11G168846v4 [Glycine max]|nr:hypothetical protein GLYMA_11G168846v4 [Glycine max]KAH1115832.1 hypothetical protein GYH30_057120 [Glycine max]
MTCSLSLSLLLMYVVVVCSDVSLTLLCGNCKYSIYLVFTFYNSLFRKQAKVGDLFKSPAVGYKNGP